MNLESHLIYVEELISGNRSTIPEFRDLIEQHPDRPPAADAAFFDELRALNDKYGRNFRNVTRFTLGSLIHRDLLANLTNFLVDIPIDELFEWMKKQFSHPTFDWRHRDYFDLRILSALLLERKTNHLATFQQADEPKDWEAWHNMILREMLVLNERYPQHFWKLLDEFLLSTHYGVIQPRDMKPEPNENETAEQRFFKWLGIVDDYQHNRFCGFMFKALDSFLLAARTALNNSLSDLYPAFFNQKPTSLGALPGQLPKMEALHEEYFSGIQEMMRIRTHRPFIREPLLFKDHPYYHTEREQRKRQLHYPRLGLVPPLETKRAVDPPAPKTPTFQISRPLPSRGGFSKMFKNDDNHL